MPVVRSFATQNRAKTAGTLGARKVRLETTLGDEYGVQLTSAWSAGDADHAPVASTGPDPSSCSGAVHPAVANGARLAARVFPGRIPHLVEVLHRLHTAPASSLTGVLLAAAAAVTVPAAASDADSHAANHRGDSRSFTYAVYGDAPYGTSPTDTTETDATPAFIRRGERRQGRLHGAARRRHPLGQPVLHEAYDQQIADLWAGFADPLVYTPGDNEWTDCHKAKEGGGTYNPDHGADRLRQGRRRQPVDYAGGNPVDNLALVRSIFFPTAGRHARQRPPARCCRRPRSTTATTPPKPVRRERDVGARRVLFVTVNVPGGSEQRRRPLVRRADRLAAADHRGRQPHRSRPALARPRLPHRRAAHARAVVVVTQADMWDLDGKDAEPPGRLRADRAEPRHAHHGVRQAGAAAQRRLARLPLGQPAAEGVSVHRRRGVCSYDAWNSHPVYDVPNFHRIVVHGSTSRWSTCA